MPEVGLLVILGATGVGKTGTSVSLAQTLSVPIISADSRQVYRHLDIGTAKPTLQERGGVAHHLLDVAEPDYNFTLSEYQQQCQDLIDRLHQQGICPILVGGTGLYIQAIVQGLKIPHVPPQPLLRQQLGELGQGYCYQLLQRLDAIACQKIHPHDHNRTVRALEVFYATGTTLSALQGQAPPLYPILQIGIRAPAPHIYKQVIHDRLIKMLQQGWLAEIADIQCRYGKNLPLLRTIGYAEMTDYLAGKFSLAQAISQATTSTLQFAKRQRTWFAKDRHIIWVEPPTEVSALLDLIHDRKNWQVHPRNDASHHAP